MYYSLYKSVQFNWKYTLLKEALTSVIEHLKRGGMIIFLNMFKGGEKNTGGREEGSKVPEQTMTSTLAALKLQNFPSWYLDWWICFYKLKRRTLGVFRLIVSILCFKQILPTCNDAESYRKCILIAWSVIITYFFKKEK